MGIRMASGDEMLHLARRLTPAQSERRERLREAARELAHEGGYAAVTIRSVAERAGVGLATVYRYFSSKDHLIAEVHAHESRALVAELAAHPPGGETKVERVEGVFHRILEVADANLNLSAAAIAAVTSGDPAANSPEYWQEMVMIPYLDAALGGESAESRAEVAEILGHLLFSLMIGLTAGRLKLDKAKEIMSRSLRLILREG
jgi:AcrR family transcriptional regulator